MEAKFDKRFLLVHIQLAEDLGCIEEVLVLEDPVEMLLAGSFQAHPWRSGCGGVTGCRLCLSAFSFQCVQTH
jgi:hypothetical protein